jgi:nicotinate-nucleotide pyrophosphorylase
MAKRTIKDVSVVKKTEDGVVIEVEDNTVEAEKVKEIVDNCQTGKCDCMSDEVKQKVQFMNFKTEKGKVAIEIKGNLTEEEIKEAMGRSKKEL